MIAICLDRACHWAVLGGTALLPRSRRIRARYRLLAGLQRRMVRRAKVGGFRSDLDAGQVEWIDRRIAGELDPVFGLGGGL